MHKRFRYILFPFSIVWGFIIWLRNKLYDKKILRSASFNFPVICVGNLAVGGTGKTPMTEYLIKMLADKYKTATLSRGYKRKTKGFLIAGENTTAADIGDEPMQIYKKFPLITVAVCEDRVIGIPQLLYARPETQVLILDDAFQHRAVKAGLSVLLTDYNNLYSGDYMLPAGNLRDVRASSKRADVIVVTKCKPDLSPAGKQIIIKELQPLPSQKIFFTKSIYGSPYHIFTKEKRAFDIKDHVLLVCGIANPNELKTTVDAHTKSCEMLSFNDHHTFTANDITVIKDHFVKVETSQKIILTTEKDAVKLLKFQSEMNALPFYVFPMSHQFMFDEESDFAMLIGSFIKSYQETKDL